MDWFPWNLVSSIAVSGPIEFFFSNADSLNLDPIYIKIKFGRICFCMRKSGNCYIFGNYLCMWTLIMYLLSTKWEKKKKRNMSIYGQGHSLIFDLSTELT